MNKFNLNGVDYKVVDSYVYQIDKLPDGTKVIIPCYKGDSRVLDEFCRTRDLKLYTRLKSIHAYGNQEGQRAKTLKAQSK